MGYVNVVMYGGKIRDQIGIVDGIRNGGDKGGLFYIIEAFIKEERGGGEFRNIINIFNTKKQLDKCVFCRGNVS